MDAGKFGNCPQSINQCYHGHGTCTSTFWLSRPFLEVTWKTRVGYARLHQGHGSPRWRCDSHETFAIYSRVHREKPVGRLCREAFMTLSQCLDETSTRWARGENVMEPFAKTSRTNREALGIAKASWSCYEGFAEGSRRFLFAGLHRRMTDFQTK